MAGRPKGALNKVTAEVKELAQKHGPDAIKTLAKLAKGADSDAAKIAACRELLDRAYGKAAQPVGGGDGTEAIKHLFGWLSND